MNAQLRRRHRGAALALAVLLPPALALALAVRPDESDFAIPRALIEEPAVGEVQLDRADLFAPLAIRTRILGAGAGGEVLELTPGADLERPDVLVYWSREDAADRVPDTAQLLGRLAGTEVRRFALPSPARGGRVHLWSLGHGALVGAAAIE